MRKKYSLLFILFSFSLLIGCNAGDVDKKDDGNVVVFFRGTIEEIMKQQRAIVSSEYGPVFVDLSVNSDVTFQVGDEVEVGYDGEMKESSPIQIRTISVELVE